MGLGKLQGHGVEAQGGDSGQEGAGRPRRPIGRAHGKVTQDTSAVAAGGGGVGWGGGGGGGSAGSEELNRRGGRQEQGAEGSRPYLPVAAYASGYGDLSCTQMGWVSHRASVGQAEAVSVHAWR